MATPPLHLEDIVTGNQIFWLTLVGILAAAECITEYIKRNKP